MLNLCIRFRLESIPSREKFNIREQIKSFYAIQCVPPHPPRELDSPG